ncbi:hypothetical protein P389DRAFT_721 [Cystobasidium minutum MCA 4210]|uniref:uncharacterized protein n=1 Tax=Cystobasidium minutum MCA 4210 TaxID=1397322 RepID=UPI0034CF5834|eukprot:jgi/Rhomi1/721/CE720_150
MTKTSDYILQEYPRLYIVGAFYSAFYSLAGIFSLVFVYNLRKHTIAHRRYMNPSVPADSGVVTSLATQLRDDLELQARSTPAKHSQSTSRTAGSNGIPRAANSVKTFKSDGNEALERLVADLILSVPVVLILEIYYPIAGHIAELHRYDTAWKWTEFQAGLFSWPHTLAGNVIIGYFIYNSWKKPGRYGAGNQTVFDSKPPSAGDQRINAFPTPSHIDTLASQDLHHSGKEALSFGLSNASFESAPAVEKREIRFTGA